MDKYIDVTYIMCKMNPLLEKSVARRLIQQNAVRINGERVDRVDQQIIPHVGDRVTVGKSELTITQEIFDALRASLGS